MIRPITDKPNEKIQLSVEQVCKKTPKTRSAKHPIITQRLSLAARTGSVSALSSPFSIYAVGIKDCVHTNYWKSFNKSLSNYQAVKRISVMKG